jgi:hypothetical protein
MNPNHQRRPMKTPDEINEEIRNQVNQENPTPKNGFETEQNEIEWEDQTQARFIDLVNRWPKH